MPEEAEQLLAIQDRRPKAKSLELSTQTALAERRTAGSLPVNNSFAVRSARSMDEFAPWNRKPTPSPWSRRDVLTQELDASKAALIKAPDAFELRRSSQPG